MGMPIVVDVRDDDAGDELLDQVFDWFREVDAVFSTYKDDSEISRLNRGELALRECSAGRAPGDRALPRAARRDGRLLRRRGGRARDDRSRRASSRAGRSTAPRRCSTRAGARNYAVNAGGDIRLRGGALPEPRWRVGIQHPPIRDKIAAVVEADDLAVATSGAYARGEHVVDPHTGRPPEGVLSVTIIGPDLATADAYATAAFAMGAAGPEWTRGLRRYEAMTITADGRKLSTAGFPARGVARPAAGDCGEREPRRAALGEQLGERGDDERVELRARRSARARRGRAPIVSAGRYGALGRHRVEGVADEDDARDEGISVAGEAVGIAGAVEVLAARAHDAGDVRERRRARAGSARRSACGRCTNSHSSAVERARLVRGSRRGSPSSRRRAARPSSRARATSASASSELDASASASSTTPSSVLVGSGWRSASAREEHAARLLLGGQPRALCFARTCAGRRARAPPTAVGRLLGKRDGAVRGGDREALALLAQRALRAGERRTPSASPRSSNDDAELVAAHPVGRRRAG